jgi:WD repeat and SOF domain-containing protein 1
MQTNAVCFNPMEAFYFSTANEDHKCYTFDIRRLDSAVNILEDHVSAVICLDYSPTGKEIVTGSYDRTVRIFPIDQGHAREVYHTKRMARIFSVQYTYDSKYIISGSDDTCLRIWKTHASEKLGNLLPRERLSKEYRDSLKTKFQHAPAIRSMIRDKKLPKVVVKARKLQNDIMKAQKEKENRNRKHSKQGSVPYVAAKKAAVRKTIQ